MGESGRDVCVWHELEQLCAVLAWSAHPADAGDAAASEAAAAPCEGSLGSTVILKLDNIEQ